MKPLSAGLIVCSTALSATTGLAHAGGCTDQIRELRRAAQIEHEPPR